MTVPADRFLLAQLSLLPTQFGGRRRPIASGFRPNFRFHRSPTKSFEYLDAAIHLEGVQWLHPGEVSIVRLQPAFPDLWEELFEGALIDVSEGPRVIGTARVLELWSRGEPQ